MNGVRAHIEIGGSRDVPGDLASLRDWLVSTPPLRGRVDVVHRPPRPGEMGGLSDALVAALGDGEAITALAASLGTWLVSRRSRVTIKVTGPDERSVEVDLRRAKGGTDDVAALLRQVLAAERPERPEELT